MNYFKINCVSNMRKLFKHILSGKHAMLYAFVRKPEVLPA